MNPAVHSAKLESTPFPKTELIRGQFIHLSAPGQGSAHSGPHLFPAPEILLPPAATAGHQSLLPLSPPTFLLLLLAISTQPKLNRKETLAIFKSRDIL